MYSDKTTGNFDLEYLKANISEGGGLLKNRYYLTMPNAKSKEQAIEKAKEQFKHRLVDSTINPFTQEDIRTFIFDVLENLKGMIESCEEREGVPCLTDDCDCDSIQLTVATTDGKQFVYQVGNNEYVGACYMHPLWATCSITKESEPEQIISEILEQLTELLSEAKDNEETENG